MFGEDLQQKEPNHSFLTKT